MSHNRSDIKSVDPGFPLLLLTLTRTSRGSYHCLWCERAFTRVSNKHLTQSGEYCIYSVRTSRAWEIAKRNRILFKYKNREPIARLYYQTYEKWIKKIICYSLCFYSMLSTEVFGVFVFKCSYQNCTASVTFIKDL